MSSWPSVLQSLPPPALLGNDIAVAPIFAPLLQLGPAEGAAFFHAALARALAEAAIAAASETGLSQVALTGGCCANARLVEPLADHLRAAGLAPLLHRAAPPGDGGIALGQAWAAGLMEL